MSWAGGNLPSFEQAARALWELAEIKIDARQVGRITERIGSEMIECRNRPDFVNTAEIPKTLPAAVIATDGGRVQVRAEDSAPGVHNAHWREDKVAQIQIIKNTPSAIDPQPEVPAIFMNRDHVRALTAQLARNARTETSSPIPKLPPTQKQKPAQNKPSHKIKNREVLFKSCVASVSYTEEFIPLLRNEIRRLNLDKATIKLFVADGGTANWTIQEALCPDRVPLLDFVHLVSHVFAISYRISEKPDEAWKLYQKLITHAWNNEADEMLKCLTKHQAHIGKPKENAPDNDPAKVLQTTIHYVQVNKDRMNYPKMRIMGLPISSCSVESLIKQINHRVKASDKFWCVPNLEAVMQVRAAELSTGRWDLFWKQREETKDPLKMAA
jgi:hypothetical protein